MRLRTGLVAVFCGVLFLNSLPAMAAETPGISSLSAVVYEPESGLVLYEKDGDTARPMASTTKLMTALLAAEKLSPEATVRVPAKALPVEGSQVGLAAGEETTVRDLLAGLLLASGNDTANALALLMADSLPAFAGMMNEKAAQLGMTNSLFVTPSGLDEGGHSASARDMALLGAAVLKQPVLAELCASKTASVTYGGRRMTLKNHNKLLSLTDDCIGLKTGFTKKSGRCLVSAVERDGITLVIATLNGGDYWNDHLALYHYAFSLVERQLLSVQVQDTLPVAGGQKDSISLTVSPPEDVVTKAGEKITACVELPRFVWAPVRAGETVGTVTWFCGDRPVAFGVITAGETVDSRPVPTGWALWWRHVKQILTELLR
ncbi:MAG: D-alanyl-D-alanine carboxypeptidase [Clostridia bacterium]|nr:D-alanyl-D-alanine carboxypeptidase [Clostridia bacterium]